MIKYILSTSSILLVAVICLAQQKELDYFLHAGLQNSPLLKIYQYQVESNKIDSQRLRASYRPQVNGNTALAYTPVLKGWGYDATVTNQHTYTSLAGVSQSLIGKNNINNQYLAIQLLNEGLQNQGKITEQDLIRSITQQYITTYGDMLQINFNQEMLTLLKGEEGILKKLAEKGVYKQTEFLSFFVTVKQQELLIKQLYLQYQNDYATLNYISGLNDTAYTLLSFPALSIPELPYLQQTIFYNQYQIDSLKIVVNDKQIDFSYRPKVNLFTDGGYNSSFVVKPYKNFGVGAGITLNVPIYDGRQRKMLHQKNRIAERIRKTDLQFFSTQYNQQIAQLKQQLLLTQDLIRQTAVQVKYTEGLIKAQRQQLITGDIRITDYIIAITNYLNAKNIITQTTISEFQIINQINYWNRKL